MPNIPIFLASDNNYAPFVATTIASICDNTKSFIDFYILDGGITKENQDKICELKTKFNNFTIEFIAIDIEKEFESIEYKNHHYISLSTYNRFLIPQLKPEIDKAIYSDVDVIVQGDIVEMYNEDLEGHALGAVWEQFTSKSDNPIRKKGSKPFYTGNLILNCNKWREENIINSLFEIEKKFRGIILNADQGVLNAFFQDNYKDLGVRYCYTIQFSLDKVSQENMLIRHYNGAIKPWDILPSTKTDLMEHLELFWRYAEKTAYYHELIERIDDPIIQQNNLKKLRHDSALIKFHLMNNKRKLGCKT